MGGYAHDRAIAVAHQNVIADPDWHRFARQGMGNEEAGWYAFFFTRRNVGLGDAAGAATLDECFDVGPLMGCQRGDRVFGCHRYKGHAHDGVRARREDIEAPVTDQVTVLVLEGVRECEAHALGTSDPVVLHGLDALGPTESVEPIDQLVCILRDPEVVHWDFALFDDGTAAPTAAVDDLLIGQDGLVNRIPVHAARAQVSNTAFQHAQKQPLVPTVIVR